MATATRGERNNNPGNIRKVKGVTWQGQLPEAEQTDPDFVRFRSPQFGVRAIARTLITYATARELDTVRKIVGRWAPPNENDTEAYVRTVARGVGVDADAALQVDRVEVMLPLVESIIRQENGRQKYASAVLMEGLRLAGVADAKPKAFAFSARVQSTAAGMAGSGVAALGLVQGGAQAVVDRGRAYSDLSPFVAKAIATAAGFAFVCGALTLGLQWVQHRNAGV